MSLAFDFVFLCLFHPCPQSPYSSSLLSIKTYRISPNFRHFAQNALSSTFSHKIDPQKPFCRFELAVCLLVFETFFFHFSFAHSCLLQGVCNNDNCPYQHLRDIAISVSDVTSYFRERLPTTSTSSSLPSSSSASSSDIVGQLGLCLPFFCFTILNDLFAQFFR
jgi:hypothetical protein